MTGDFDVAVIGAGPGGYIAAIRAAQLGLRTVCIDDWQTDGKPAPGGTCTNVGCIPSKAILEASAHYRLARQELASFGVIAREVGLDMARLQARRAGIVRQSNDGIAFLFRKNKVTFFNGTASFVGRDDGGAYRIRVSAGTKGEITCTHVIIATGSKPRAWPGVPFDEHRVLSNTGVLAMETVPETLAVIGAGVVGLEMGTAWQRLGAAVTLLESRPAILAGADTHVVQEMHRQLTRQGLTIHTGVTVEAVTPQDDGVTITYRDAAGETRQLRVERVLVSIGRVPYTGGLGAEKIGLACDEHGFIPVDEQCRTKQENVWAIGDVVRGPMLAHKAEEEGVAVAERIAGRYGHVDYRTIPWVVYTHPELAWVGQSEDALRQEGRAYRCGTFPFMANGRARTMGSTEGFVKILADATTDEVLGVHLIGPMASELVAEAAMAMAFRASSEDIARICHAHPTLSEVVREAALAVDGRALNA